MALEQSGDDYPCGSKFNMRGKRFNKNLVSQSFHLEAGVCIMEQAAKGSSCDRWKNTILKNLAMYMDWKSSEGYGLNGTSLDGHLGQQGGVGLRGLSLCCISLTA